MEEEFFPEDDKLKVLISLLEGRGGAWRVSTFDSEYKLP
jgi:hypothetical protein